jgi:hypothetical protein
MSGDGPSTIRVGFGVRQALKAHVPCPSPRSSSGINLENFLKRHPELMERVSEMLRKKISADRILEEIRSEGLDGRFSLQLWRDTAQEDLIREDYSDDKKRLKEEAEWSFAHGACKLAIIWKLNQKTGEWKDILYWPESARS